VNFLDGAGGVYTMPEVTWFGRKRVPEAAILPSPVAGMVEVPGVANPVAFVVDNPSQWDPRRRSRSRRGRYRVYWRETLE
jgi:hypothetical protein